MNKRLFNKIVRLFNLSDADAKKLYKLCELHHSGSHYADEEFDRLLEEFSSDSDVVRALDQYQKLVALPPKSILLLKTIFVGTSKILSKLLKLQFKEALKETEAGARNVCVVVIAGTDYGIVLYLRVLVTEVGFLSGTVTPIDVAFAQENNLAKLNKFERWMMRDIIQEEIDRRWREWQMTLLTL